MEETEQKENAAQVACALREAGFRAFFVGGCVRDMILGEAPKDFDVATDALPGQVLSLFGEAALPIGEAFGVIMVMTGSGMVEVATFRSEAGYDDGRRPSSVDFCSPEEDALRRDFTINGLFMDPETGQVNDWVEGLRDINAGIVRAIGDPLERFAEDHLRMLRAVRFAARFGFKIDEETESAIRGNAHLVERVSAERIQTELVRMLTGRRRGLALTMLRSLRLLPHVLPEVDAMSGCEQGDEHPEGDVFDHTVLLLEKLEPTTSTSALAALLHDAGKPPTRTIDGDRPRFTGHETVGARIAEEACRRLKCSSAETARVAWLVKNHMKFNAVSQMRISTLKRFMRQEGFQELLSLHRADCLASHGDLSSWQFCVDKLKELGQEELAPEKLITGRDLISLGWKPGPFFREVLSEVETRQLEGSVKTRREAMAVAIEMSSGTEEKK